MKSFKDMFSEAKVAKGVNDGSKESGLTKVKSEDEQNFINKHIATKQDHPVAGDDQFSGEVKGMKKRKPRPADVSKEDGEDMNEMTDAQKLKRDEIVSAMTGRMARSFELSVEEEVEVLPLSLSQRRLRLHIDRFVVLVFFALDRAVVDTGATTSTVFYCNLQSEFSVAHILAARCARLEGFRRTGELFCFVDLHAD